MRNLSVLLKFHCTPTQGQVDLQLTKQVVKFIASQAQSPRKQPLVGYWWNPSAGSHLDSPRLKPSSAHFAKCCIRRKANVTSRIEPMPILIPCFTGRLLPSTVLTVPLPALPPSTALTVCWLGLQALLFLLRETLPWKGPSNCRRAIFPCPWLFTILSQCFPWLLTISCLYRLYLSRTLSF